MLRAFTAAIILYFFCPTINAKTINWLMHDFAPYYILNGENKHRGRDESIIDLLEQQLPHITFERTIIPSGKVLQELANSSKNSCALSLYKNEFRKERIYFTEESSTTGLSPSIAMHTSLSDSLQLPEAQPVSLLKLLADDKLTLGISMSRSYGREIDRLINTTPDIALIIRPTRDSLATLTYMLNLQRIDILLGYPSEHYYLAKTMHFTESLTQRPLTEAPALSYGYIGCTKNKQGAEDIALLNQQLKIIKQTQAYNSILMRWLPEPLKASLQARMQAIKNAT